MTPPPASFRVEQEEGDWYIIARGGGSSWIPDYVAHNILSLLRSRDEGAVDYGPVRRLAEYGHDQVVPVLGANGYGSMADCLYGECAAVMQWLSQHAARAEQNTDKGGDEGPDAVTSARLGDAANHDADNITEPASPPASLIRECAPPSPMHMSGTKPPLDLEALVRWLRQFIDAHSHDAGQFASGRDWMAHAILDRIEDGSFDLAASATGAAKHPYAVILDLSEQEVAALKESLARSAGTVQAIPAALPPALGEALERLSVRYNAEGAFNDLVGDDFDALDDVILEYDKHRRPRASGENAAGDSGKLGPCHAHTDSHNAPAVAGEAGTSPGTPAAREHDDMEGLGPCGGRRCWRNPNGVWIHSSKSYGSCSVRLSTQVPRRADDEAAKCPRCKGTGVIDAPTSADDPSCQDCDGEGVIAAPAAATGAVSKLIEDLRLAAWKVGTAAARGEATTAWLDEGKAKAAILAQLTAQSAECARLREEVALLSQNHDDGVLHLEKRDERIAAIADRLGIVHEDIIGIYALCDAIDAALTARLAESVGVKEVERELAGLERVVPAPARIDSLNPRHAYCLGIVDAVACLRGLLSRRDGGA